MKLKISLDCDESKDSSYEIDQPDNQHEYENTIMEEESPELDRLTERVANYKQDGLSDIKVGAGDLSDATAEDVAEEMNNLLDAHEAGTGVPLVFDDSKATAEESDESYKMRTSQQHDSDQPNDDQFAFSILREEPKPMLETIKDIKEFIESLRTVGTVQLNEHGKLRLVKKIQIPESLKGFDFSVCPVTGNHISYVHIRRDDANGNQLNTGGMTLAYSSAGYPGNVVSVASALCSPNDSYINKIGVIKAFVNLVENRSIQMYLPVKEYRSSTLKAMFSCLYNN